MCEELLDTMPLHEKKLWLKKHGSFTGGGYDPERGFHVIWETRIGLRFMAMGHSNDDIDADLFKDVFKFLYKTTCDVNDH